MALTDIDIINNQLKRINENSNLNIVFRKINTYFYLYTRDGDYAPLSSADIGRSADQLIEYLAGLEDALIYTQKQQAQ